MPLKKCLSLPYQLLMPIDHGETHSRGILKKKTFVLAQPIMTQDMEISLPFQVTAAGAHVIVDLEAESVRIKVDGTVKGLPLVACFSQPCPIS